MSAEQTQFTTGAVRSADRAKQRYDLISPIGLRRLAETCHEGAEKYSDFNWEKGMPIHDILNHAIAHVYAYLSGDRSEDHLAHAAWNCFAAMHSEELWPHLNRQHLRISGCRPPVEATADPNDLPPHGERVQVRDIEDDDGSAWNAHFARGVEAAKRGDQKTLQEQGWTKAGIEKLNAHIDAIEDETPTETNIQPPDPSVPCAHWWALKGPGYTSPTEKKAVVQCTKCGDSEYINECVAHKYPIHPDAWGLNMIPGVAQPPPQPIDMSALAAQQIG